MRRAPAVCAQHQCPADAVKDGRCHEHRRKWDNTNRKARLTVTSGWAEQRRAANVIARDGGVCHLCGLMGADQADHILALAEGGADDPSNMAPIHSQCHARKSKAEQARANTRRHTTRNA